MANIELKVGDVVQLKSGGPLMTVCDIDGELISTEWFAENGTIDSALFHPATLHLIEQ